MSTVINFPQLRRRPEWTFADRIRKVRRDERLTQAAFGERLGFTAKNIDSWEAGRNKPADLIGFARLVERTFDIDPAWILGLDDSPNGPDGGQWAPRGSNPQPTGYRSVRYELAAAA